MTIKKLYVDIESTGTDPKRHGIIQWSAILLVNGRKVDEIDMKMQPFKEDELDDGALKHNHTSALEVFAEDRYKPLIAYERLMEFFGKHCNKYDRLDKFFWVGYRASFDSDFTREFFDKIGDRFLGSWFWTPPLDCMGLAAYLLQKNRYKLRDFKLRSVFEYLRPDMIGVYQDLEEKGQAWHNAMFDIERTLDIEDALRKLLIGGKQNERQSNPSSDSHTVSSV
jgi:DNA polymerase-3 subunit epsilon